MDIISSVIKLKKMRFSAYHGVMEQERKVGGNFVVNLVLQVEQIQNALFLDQLEGTVNYAEAYVLVKREMERPSQLLEHVAARIAQAVLNAFEKVIEVKVEVAKENPPLGGNCKSSAVELRVKSKATPPVDKDSCTTVQKENLRSLGDVGQAILTRRSFRHFLPTQISDEELEAVLNVATYAPTGHGAQSPVIVAVQNEALKQKLIQMNAAVLGTNANPYYDAPTIVLVFAPPVCHTWQEDGSLVLGTMMLAAHAVGLGSCWIHREREMFASDEGKQLMHQMGLPDNLAGIGALALGYPKGEPAPQKPRKADYYKILK
ncbi:MAG: dihydroneopterin aldolase [Bacteroidaceae bacterium]